MTLIETTDDLKAFCDRIKGAEYITVDTEFMREKTYWPQLCLLQIADRNEAAAIDTLANGMDLAPVWELFEDSATIKVLHAARQDLEIFYHLSGRLPAPVFDTQVAAMVCGFGDAVGYEQLVNKLAKEKVDKSSRFTDWALRPLTRKQIDYALADVIHLRPVYEKLHGRLEREQRTAWIDEEMAVLTRPETYINEPTEVFRRIKSRSAHPRVLALLRELAAWRELEAQRRNVPRNRVLRDETLLEIAHHAPGDPQALARTRGLGNKAAAGEFGRSILEAVARGKATPEEDWPRPPERVDLPRGIGPVADLLKVLLKMKCEEYNVAGKLIASSADVDRVAAFGERADVAALHGWRRGIYGDDALKLRAGELGISVEESRLVLKPAVTRAP